MSAININVSGAGDTANPSYSTAEASGIAGYAFWTGTGSTLLKDAKWTESLSSNNYTWSGLSAGRYLMNGVVIDNAGNMSVIKSDANARTSLYSWSVYNVGTTSGFIWNCTSREACTWIECRMGQ